MTIVNSDISSSLDDIISFLLSVYKYCFDFLKGIEFFGTNLFTFTITVFLLGVIFPIIFTLVQSRSVRIANSANELHNKIRSRRSRSGSSSTELSVR